MPWPAGKPSIPATTYPEHLAKAEIIPKAALIPLPFTTCLFTFIDSNVLIYLLSADAKKADQAETVMQRGGLISVQVLNEVANVARRKLTMPWEELNELLSLIRKLCPAEPFIDRRNARQRYIDRSEVMPDGLLIDNQLRICNPFK